jgi:glycosyltransferase involved in cell wall biosynthesis
MVKKRICLITPGHVSSCPRIVKEADALVEAGYEVTLVSGRNFEPVLALDRVILSRARWNHREVPSNRGLRAGLRRVARKGLQLLRPRIVGTAAAEFFVTPGLPALIEVAVQIRADLYHAHCLGGLPAAAAASRAMGKPFSFDVEDFHEEESDAVLSNPTERAAVARLMKEHLPRAAFVTAASPLIADACAERYGVKAVPLLNAFLPQKTTLASGGIHPFTKENPARLYWFSQTIGPGRGLEEMIDVIALMKTPVVLQLRGFVSKSYRASLEAKAASEGARIEFLPPGEPDEMVALAAEADIGLSLEQSAPPNRDICLTNKVFVYLAAGIPQLMSKTRAQGAFGKEIGQAAILADMRDRAATAQKLNALLRDPVALEAARRQAVAMGEKFSWEGEKRRFVELVNKAVFR